jgi:hypothetical protein
MRLLSPHGLGAPVFSKGPPKFLPKKIRPAQPRPPMLKKILSSATMTPASASANFVTIPLAPAPAVDPVIDAIVLRACLGSTRSRPFRQYVKRFFAKRG